MHKKAYPRSPSPRGRWKPGVWRRPQRELNPISGLEVSPSERFSGGSEGADGQEATPGGRLATGLATAVADLGGGGAVTLSRPELLGNLLDLGRAIEAGDRARALDLLAALIGRVGSGDTSVATADEG